MKGDFVIRGFFFAAIEVVYRSIYDVVNEILRVTVVGKGLLKSIDFGVEDLPGAGYFDSSIYEGFYD